jgi:hypothetical protein
MMVNFYSLFNVKIQIKWKSKRLPQSQNNLCFFAEKEYFKITCICFDVGDFMKLLVKQKAKTVDNG